MKKQRKQNHKRLQRKHAKAVARKGRGAVYGASVKMFNKMSRIQARDPKLVAGIGTGVSEVNSPAKQDTVFVEDPTQKLKDKMADADKGTITISQCMKDETKLEKLKPYGNHQTRYHNPPYSEYKDLLFEHFEKIDREQLKLYIDRAYSEWFAQKHK